MLLSFLELRWVPHLIIEGTKFLALSGESPLFGFAEFHAYKLKEHALIIWPYMQEGLLSSFL